MLTIDQPITSVERVIADISVQNNSELFSNTQSASDFYDEAIEKDQLSISNIPEELCVFPFL